MSIKEDEETMSLQQRYQCWNSLLWSMLKCCLDGKSESTLLYSIYCAWYYYSYIASKTLPIFPLSKLLAGVNVLGW